MIKDKIMVGYRWDDGPIRIKSFMFEHKLCKHLKLMGYTLESRTDKRDVGQTVLTFGYTKRKDKTLHQTG